MAGFFLYQDMSLRVEWLTTLDGILKCSLPENIFVKVEQLVMTDNWKLSKKIRSAFKEICLM